MTLRDFQHSDADEWRIEWEDNDPESRTSPSSDDGDSLAPQSESRTTTIALIAWFADEHDEEATVYEVNYDGDDVTEAKI